MSGDRGRGVQPWMLTLLYRMRDYFRVDKQDNIIGVKISKADMNKAIYPDNFIVGQGVNKIVVSTTPPVSPQEGDIWIDIS
jgi:hypothetical protein